MERIYPSYPMAANNPALHLEMENGNCCSVNAPTRRLERSYIIWLTVQNTCSVRYWKGRRHPEHYSHLRSWKPTYYFNFASKMMLTLYWISLKSNPSSNWCMRLILLNMSESNQTKWKKYPVHPNISQVFLIERKIYMNLSFFNVQLRFTYFLRWSKSEPPESKVYTWLTTK